VPTTVQCATCGSENPAGQHFCGNCGSPLPQRCPACSTEAPPGARFCGSCGATLGSDAGRGDAPLVARAGPEERRIASVLFADLSGFTALSGQIDPEDARALVDRCMTLMGEVVSKFEGHIDKIIGDAMMALWGVPIAREDHAERAVRAALAMQQCAREHADEFHGLPLRIGVNTGEILFAPVGPEARREQTVMGDVVNMASRLQTSAPRGGILVGEETWRATRRAIRFEQVEPFIVKGKDDPVDAWLALEAIGAGPAERPLSSVPMVGRERELDLLRKTWQRVTNEARPHFVLVLGAPGVGKSRLCRELRVEMEAQGAEVIRSRSLPYGESSGFAAFAETVRSVAGVFDTDPPQEALHKLEARIRSLLEPAHRDEVSEALAIMTGLGPGQLENRAVLFDAARMFVEALASERPVVLGFEDLHWADESLLDLLEHLAGRVRDVPVLFLATARPELLDTRPGLGGGLGAYTALPLGGLSDEAADELSREVLRGHAVSPAVLEQISDAAEGNPLFIEELATSIAEGTTDPTQQLPTNVVSIIAARLDGVPPRERNLLLNAAVIGRTFWRGLLVALDPDPGLDTALVWLEDREYIRHEPSSDLEGDQAYSFRHMALREVAYNTLPRAERRGRHAAVASRLEQSVGESRTLATVLAYHWRSAGDTERALEYLLDAADQADQAWAKREAAMLYTEALDLLEDGDPRRRSVALRRAVSEQAIRHIELGDVQPPTSTDDLDPSVR
jgi:class 3 adenylate cyclase